MPSALKTELAELKKDVEERYPAEIAELEAKRDAARAKGQTASGESLEGKASERRGRLAEGKAKLDALITKVDGYVIKAAAAGVFTTTLATGAKVAVGDALGTVTPAEVLRGEVELAGTTKDAASYTVGADVAAKAAGATLTCKVVTIAGTKLTIECPSGAAAAGASIELT